MVTRVVFVDHTSILGGAERSLLDLVEGFAAERSIEAHVVLGEPGPLADLLAGRGLRHRVVDARVGGLTRNSGPMATITGAWAVGAWSARLRRSIGEIEPDVVVANTLKAGVATGPAVRPGGRPFVWVVRDRLAPDYLGRSARQGLRMALRLFPTAVVANSRETARWVSSGNVQVIHPGVALHPRIRPDAARPLTIGVVARLATWKGQDRAIRAFARAFADGDQRLRLVGGPSFVDRGAERIESDLREVAAAEGVADRVDFTGDVEDVFGELATIDVLLHTPRSAEPFGRNIVEALAAGVPVVATAAGGPVETVEHDVTGLLVEPDDDAGLVAALRRLADDEIRRPLAANGPVAAARFGVDVAVGAWTTLLEGLAREATP